MRRSIFWIALIGAVCFAAPLVVASETGAEDPFGSLEADLDRLRSGLTSAPRSSLGDFSLIEAMDPSRVVNMPVGMENPNADPNAAAQPADGAVPTAADAVAAASDAIPTPAGIESPVAAAPESIQAAGEQPGQDAIQVVGQGELPGGGVKGGMVKADSAPQTQTVVAQEPAAVKQVSEADSLKAQTEASRKAAAAMTATTNPADANQPRPSQVQAPKLLKSVNTVKQALSGNVDSIGVHLNNIVNDVSSIVRTKEQFKNALNGEAGAQAKAFDSAADKIKADAATYLRGQSARSTKDVLDCTACRFAWMHVEVDMGNTYSEKALYDAFVHHCAEMQMSRIFFSACNDMFVQVDDMIGDYLNGHTVNQLCMNARMCR